jgi:hypothetical protein
MVGDRLYVNSLASRETRDLGFYTLKQLVLEDTTHLLASTFDWAGDGFLNDTFGMVPNLLVIQDASRVTGGASNAAGNAAGNAASNAIGAQTLSAIPTMSQTNKNWHRLSIKPIRGIQHSKIILLRCEKGLRVIIAGSNFNKQWSVDRDVFWCQDFYNGEPHAHSRRQSRPCSTFEDDLSRFLRNFNLATSTPSTSVYENMLSSTLDNIDFTTSKASLVQSFPLTKTNDDNRDSGVYSLARAVKQQGGMESKTVDMFVTSGSMGNISPAFLLTMKAAMAGAAIERLDEGAEAPPSWDDVTGTFVLWPSCETALKLNPYSVLCCGRALPREHWREIPESAKDRIFFDAPPNPSEPLDDNESVPPGFCPVVHGKCILAVGREQGESLVYCGSHNFSKNAFGLPCEKYSAMNVELGVVLRSTDEIVGQSFVDCFPCELPSVEQRKKTARQRKYFFPASGTSSLLEQMKDLRGHAETVEAEAENPGAREGEMTRNLFQPVYDGLKEYLTKWSVAPSRDGCGDSTISFCPVRKRRRAGAGTVDGWEEALAFGDFPVAGSVVLTTDGVGELDVEVQGRSIGRVPDTLRDLFASAFEGEIAELPVMVVEMKRVLQAGVNAVSEFEFVVEIREEEFGCHNNGG